ncbi:MAG: polysaccharide biosynthesis C-terminal domain-containing protein [Lachnospiraceae bacterium]|nr:polysaccharide biosynthesis C-terminal domain-containing protein [Lachnospiraceae bacterium]
MIKGKYKYLFKNMALFTISSLVSKLLVFLLVPFYTSILTESEYGIADVMQSTLLLGVPLLSINAGEAALRFGLDKGADHGEILRIGLKRVFFSDLLALILSGGFFAFRLITKKGPEPEYIVLFFFLFLFNSFYEYMLLYCQGTEKVQIMIMGSVSCTFLVIICNIFFLLFLSLGLYGYLFAQMIAYTGSAMLMFSMVGGDVQIKKIIKDRKLEREMFDYGSGMLLYSTSSWINNALDRYYILLMLGSSENGLYGAAYKIPAILTIFQRIFAQAWQMSAAKEYDEKDRDKFFSNMFRIYSAIMVLGAAGIILFLKILARIMFQKSFFEAWVLVPPLLISVIFGALEGFMGSICLAFKDGKSIGRATGLGALVNIVLNYFLIIEFATMGAAIATLISYFVMFAAAYIMVKKYVKLDVSMAKNFFAYILLIVESLAVIVNIKNFYLINSIILLILLLIYMKEIAQFLTGLKKR